LYVNTVKNLARGLSERLDSYAASNEMSKQHLYHLWKYGQPED
jgi:hypothetical protein